MCWPRHSGEWVWSVKCDGNMESGGAVTIKLKISWVGGWQEMKVRRRCSGGWGPRWDQQPHHFSFCPGMRSFGLCERFTPGFVLGRGRAPGVWSCRGIRGAVWLEQPENLQTWGPSWLWIHVCRLSVGWSVLSFPFWVSKRKWKPVPLKWISRIWIYWAACPFQTKPANSCPCPHLPVESWLVTPLAFDWCRLHDMTPCSMGESPVEVLSII